MSGKSLNSSLFSKNLATGTPATIVNANFTNTPTNTYISNGVLYKAVVFTGNSSLIIDKTGVADLFMIGGGGNGYNHGPDDSGPDGGAGAGGVINRSYTLSAGTYSVVIGGATSNTSLNFSSLAGNQIIAFAGGNGGNSLGGSSGGGQAGQGFPGQVGYADGRGGGAGGPGSANGPPLNISLSGSTVAYGKGGSGYQGTDSVPTVNSGNGGNDGRGGGGTGSSGIVIVRVRV
jgi:hypothetical protein